MIYLKSQLKLLCVTILKISAAALLILLTASARTRIVSAYFFALTDSFVGCVCAVSRGFCRTGNLLTVECLLYSV